MILLSLLSDGGPVFMYPILFLLISIIVLIVRAFISKANRKKSISLIASIAMFTLAWGVTGQILGLIAAFDVIEANDGVSMAILAGGLKISFLPTLFGLVTFMAARLGIIALTWGTNGGN